MVRAHPTRQETRRAVLSYLWCSKGDFRPEIVTSVGLTEASVNRIVAELKAEGVLEESRRAARYHGGTTAFFTLSQNMAIGAIEISNNRIHVGVGALAGEIRHSDRHELPDGSSAADVEDAILRAVGDLSAWSARRGVDLEHIAVSIPGFHPGKTGNSIIALDPDFVSGALECSFPSTPVTLANSIVTRALSHRLQLGTGHAGGTYLHVFVGHGVGGAIVDELAESGSIQPMEIGHMVLDMQGPKCRCGHLGCLEAFSSTSRVAEIVGVKESAILTGGDHWAEDIHVSARAMRQLRDILVRIGVAIGNTINLAPVRRVVVTGWPAGLPAENWVFIKNGIDQSLLGSLTELEISVAAAAMGREPASGLALAAYAFLQNGGERPIAIDKRNPHSNKTERLASA